MSDVNRDDQGPEGRAPDFGEARRVAGNEADAARGEFARAGESARAEAGRFAQGARQKAIDAAESGKNQAVGGLEDFTAAIRRASDELGERDQSMAAQLVREAASGLEQATGAIRGQSVSDLMRSTGDFARRQPGAFLFGAALAGVALGRFLRASADHADGERLGLSGGRGGGGGYRNDTSNRDHMSDRDDGRSGYRSGGSERFPGAAATGAAGASGSTNTVGLTSSPTADERRAGSGGENTSRATTAAPGPSYLGTPGTSGTTGTSGLVSDPDRSSTINRDETR